MADRNSDKKQKAKTDSSKVKNMRITVDTTQVEESLDIGYGVDSDAHYGPLDWDMESTDTVATAEKATAAKTPSVVASDAAASASVLQEDESREVTFKVTMDEKKTQEHLYGKGAPKAASANEPEDADGDIESGEEESDGGLSESEKVRPFVMRKAMDLDMTAPDVNDPEVKEMRKKRAERFGIRDTEADTVVDADKMAELYKEFGVSGHARVDRYFLDKLNVRGVDELSTYDINRYFADFYPTRIEWVNDTSCNVCFRNPEWAANCMIKMTKPLQRLKMPRTHEDGEISSSSDEEGQIGAKKKTRNKRLVPDADRMSDDGAASDSGTDSSPEADNRKAKPNYTSVMKRPAAAAAGDEAADPETVPDDPKPSSEAVAQAQGDAPPKETWADRADQQQADGPEDLQDTGNAIAVDVRKHMVPPGRWRVCIKHCPKAEVLLVRFAGVRDVKEEEAQWKSEYYRKYGNPNFSGLMSQTLKRRLQGDLRAKLEPAERASWMRRDKVRTGMNVFDNEGNELDWDYEHDTRFFDQNKFNQRSAALDKRLGKRKAQRSAAASASSSGSESPSKPKPKDKEADEEKPAADETMDVDEGGPSRRKKRSVGLGMRADKELEKQQQQRRRRSVRNSFGGESSDEEGDWNAARVRTQARQASPERWPCGQTLDSDNDDDSRSMVSRDSRLSHRLGQSKQPWDPPELSRMKVTVHNNPAATAKAARQRDAHEPDSDWSVEADDIV